MPLWDHQRIHLYICSWEQRHIELPAEAEGAAVLDEVEKVSARRHIIAELKPGVSEACNASLPINCGLLLSEAQSIQICLLDSLLGEGAVFGRAFVFIVHGQLLFDLHFRILIASLLAFVIIYLVRILVIVLGSSRSALGYVERLVLIEALPLREMLHIVSKLVPV